MYIFKAEYIHNIMHVLPNMVQMLLFLWLFTYDIKNSDSVIVSSTGETMIESEFFIVYVTIDIPEIWLYAHKKYDLQFNLALEQGDSETGSSCPFHLCSSLWLRIPSWKLQDKNP
jgi:hypothetical protein